MTKDGAVKELEEYLRDADKAISEDEEFIRGWKSALLVALEVVHNISLLKEQEAIKDQPEIVRCKDCKYWLPMNRFVPDYHPGRGECEWNCWVRDFDWFCADACRKEE